MANRTSLTPIKKEKFLKILEESANVSRAAKAIGVSRRTIYDHKKSDVEFSAAWEDAIESGVDALEEEARRRAYEGTQKPVYYLGKKRGFIREYSDTLMIFLLKANRPEKFKDRFEHTGKDGKDLIPDVKTLIEKVYGNSGKADK